MRTAPVVSNAALKHALEAGGHRVVDGFIVDLAHSREEVLAMDRDPGFSLQDSLSILYVQFVSGEIRYLFVSPRDSLRATYKLGVFEDDQSMLAFVSNHLTRCASPT